MLNKKIRLSKSVVGREEADALRRVIFDDGYLGMGKEVKLFEEELKKFLKTKKDVICVNSGTAALHLAVMSAVEPREEVLVQSLTYVASFQAISAAGALPVACEINPKTLTIDLDDAQKKLTKKTKAIMPVHYSGNVGDLEAIYDFAKKYNLRVIEDAAHAFGSIYKGGKIGSFGDIVCFSFDGIKNITCGEGGAIVTADKRIVQFCKDARLLGVEKDTEKRYQGKRSWEFDVTHQGYRYHMSNLFAALGRVQLSKFLRFKKARQSLAKKYYNSFKTNQALGLLEIDYNKVVPHIFPIRVFHGRREGLRQYLIEKDIECGVHYYPNHFLTFYGEKRGELPVTEKVYNEILSLPLHPELNIRQQRYIINKVKEFLA